ncbi:MAG: zinc ribbon domain-containing protein, partial [Armatimonadetes bacterium]|nr:zinc ribbon domain-containing protein [Armatimonadota bacterium]
MTCPACGTQNPSGARFCNNCGTDETQTRLAFQQEVTYAEGRVFLAVQQPAEAHEAGRVLSALVARTGTGHWRVLALQVQADALMAMGRLEDAHALYSEAAEEAERQGGLPRLWRALAGLAEASQSMGKPDQAAAHAARARVTVDRLAGTVPDERLRAGFL